MPGHFARTGPVLVGLRAGPVPVYFAPAGPLLGDVARAGSLPAHYGRPDVSVLFHGPEEGISKCRASSATCAGASCTGCRGPICACVSFSAAQAWNCLNRASDGGSLVSVWLRPAASKGQQFRRGRRVPCSRRQIESGNRLNCWRRLIGARLKRRFIDQRSRDVRKERNWISHR